MLNRTALGLTIASMLVLSSTVAFADTAAAPDQQNILQSNAAQVITAGDGNRGRLDGEMRLRYPGFEQSTVVYSKGHVVVITMEAVHKQGSSPVQCSCSSYKLRPDGAPQEVVSLKRLTEYTRGERACNHPKAAADDAGNIVWGYGSDSMNNETNQPDTYAGILNEKCEHLSAPQMVSIRRNANDGAFDIAHLGGGKFIAGYYSDGGNGPGFPEAGGDYSVAMGLQVNSTGLLPTLTRNWIMPIVTPTNIGRPSVAAAGPDRAILCAPKGPNRPSDHVECALLDTNNGNTLWKAEVAKGDRQKKIYFNQPTIARVGENKFALLALESSGQRQNGNNVKGSNTTHLFMLERNGDALITQTEIVGAGAHQTHASICTGAYGEKGLPAVSVFSAAPTGVGRAAMTMVGYDDAAKKFTYDPKGDMWPAAWYGDSGHLSNWYGRNPMKQGRDFMRCIGDVPNPGYGVEGGYMKDVKTFFVGAVHGRVPGDAKNSLFVSFVPGQMDKKVQPQNPMPAGQSPVVDPTASTPSGSGDADAGGCGCSTPGSSSTNNTFLALGLSAVGAIVVARRRRR
ncbi:MAG: hypothetical protein JST00_41370 [Deltaproteobacteria bacterium]|nr:hypothetical protein [Deltaproteobacteria bacterium]